MRSYGRRSGFIDRDLREQAFARSVIALAARRWLKAEVAQAPNLCPICLTMLEDDEHWPYCSARCGVVAEADR